MSFTKAALTLFLLVALCVLSQAPRSHAQSTAQIGSASPLPVFVTNTPPLPEEFSEGSRWRFTTWTTPTVFTWLATVNKTNGPWAYLTVQAQDGTTSARWYYVPNMPGSWEKQ